MESNCSSYIPMKKCWVFPYLFCSMLLLAAIQTKSVVGMGVRKVRDAVEVCGVLRAGSKNFSKKISLHIYLSLGFFWWQWRIFVYIFFLSVGCFFYRAKLK